MTPADPTQDLRGEGAGIAAIEHDLSEFRAGYEAGSQEFAGCNGCQKPCSIEDAYRCLNCKGWYHERCLRKHFGGNVTDRDRITHLEAQIEFLTYQLRIGTLRDTRA